MIKFNRQVNRTNNVQPIFTFRQKVNVHCYFIVHIIRSLFSLIARKIYDD